MRLAQAARKLSITTEDIVSFLAKKEIHIIKDSNTKLNEESLELLYNYYGRPEDNIQEVKNTPIKVEEEKIVAAEEKLEDELPQNTEEENKPEPIAKEEEPNQPSLEEADAVTETIQDKEPSEESEVSAKAEELKTTEQTAPKKFKTVSDLLEEQEANKESEEDSEDVVIKAPKVSLQGLQVLGKIDLPEPKAKPEKEEKAEKPERKNKKREPYKNKRKARNKRRELSPQEIRERERKRAERKRKEAEAAKKKSREEYYLENVLKPKQEVQKKKQSKKKVKKPQPSQNQPNKPAPKTLLGKFWRWLNT